MGLKRPKNSLLCVCNTTSECKNLVLEYDPSILKVDLNRTFRPSEQGYFEVLAVEFRLSAAL